MFIKIEYDFFKAKAFVYRDFGMYTKCLEFCKEFIKMGSTGIDVSFAWNLKMEMECKYLGLGNQAAQTVQEAFQPDNVKPGDENFCLLSENAYEFSRTPNEWHKNYERLKNNCPNNQRVKIGEKLLVTLKERQLDLTDETLSEMHLDYARRYIDSNPPQYGLASSHLEIALNLIPAVYPKFMKTLSQLVSCYVQIDTHIKHMEEKFGFRTNYSVFMPKRILLVQKGVDNPHSFSPAHFLSYLSYAFYQLGDIDTAEDSIQKAIKANPDIVEFHYQLATQLGTRLFKSIGNNLPLQEYFYQQIAEFKKVVENSTNSILRESAQKGQKTAFKFLMAVKEGDLKRLSDYLWRNISIGRETLCEDYRHPLLLPKTPGADALLLAKFLQSGSESNNSQSLRYFVALYPPEYFFEILQKLKPHGHTYEIAIQKLTTLAKTEAGCLGMEATEILFLALFKSQNNYHQFLKSVYPMMEAISGQIENPRAFLLEIANRHLDPERMILLERMLQESPKKRQIKTKWWSTSNPGSIFSLKGLLNRLFFFGLTAGFLLVFFNLNSVWKWLSHHLAAPQWAKEKLANHTEYIFSAWSITLVIMIFVNWFIMKNLTRNAPKIEPYTTKYNLKMSCILFPVKLISMLVCGCLFWLYLGIFGMEKKFEVAIMSAVLIGQIWDFLTEIRVIAKLRNRH
jgi:tetratricopeptide (TPR) repeat protein/uncharacterized membrane protein YhdT